MSILLRHIRHLARYFALLGAAVFALHWFGIAEKIVLIFIGPPIYLAYLLKSGAESYIEIQNTPANNHFFFLLPVTVVYYTLIGFLVKQIWNERGWIQRITFMALFTFLVFIHYGAWEWLSGYFQPAP